MFSRRASQTSLSGEMSWWNCVNQQLGWVSRLVSSSSPARDVIASSALTLDLKQCSEMELILLQLTEEFLSTCTHIHITYKIKLLHGYKLLMCKHTHSVFTGVFQNFLRDEICTDGVIFTEVLQSHRKPAVLVKQCTH